MLLLLLPQGPAPPSGVHLASVIAEQLAALGATSFTDLDWTSEAEMYQWADEAGKRLANRTGFWVDREGGRAVGSGAHTHALPAGHVATVHVSLDDVTLRAMTAAELEALSAGWPADSGAVARFSIDAALPGNLRLYKVPTATGTMAIIYRRYRPRIESGSGPIPAPSPVGDYFGYAILAEARRKESDAAMPEMAAHFDERLKLFEQLIERYWGPGR
jgi:hypothetical protein